MKPCSIKRAPPQPPLWQSELLFLHLLIAKIRGVVLSGSQPAGPMLQLAAHSAKNSLESLGFALIVFAFGCQPDGHPSPACESAYCSALTARTCRQARPAPHDSESVVGERRANSRQGTTRSDSPGVGQQRGNPAAIWAT